MADKSGLKLWLTTFSFSKRQNRQLNNLLRFLSSTGFTGVFEILNPKHSHVEDLSHLKKPLLQFIAWTTSSDLSLNSKLCSMPSDVAIQIRKSYQKEGEVLYFITSDDVTIGLLKKKSIWYIICRAIREKVRGALNPRRRNSNHQAVVRKIEQRIGEIQIWLGLDKRTTSAWKKLGVSFYHWSCERGNSEEITNQFPVMWKRFLEDTNQTDQII
ncbi:hypothetical protein CAPTEDRAFT_221450 [Capitella teleta]|uniref:Uncharacterized protein n=1 Tax=Capitella teleta TaxID=283909 RepID=R7TU82_CAPTE|nr:hypothetical protein CAPTEDRAFT_221450 [Capitella teleta]|eukprot:ELT97468.1 hypothetical protein CAPTEDRAFT_221450 [Capitella teleta]